MVNVHPKDPKAEFGSLGSLEQSDHFWVQKKPQRAMPFEAFTGLNCGLQKNATPGRFELPTLSLFA
jgi:hypothetical protein